VHPPTGCKFAPRCPYAQERCLTEEPPLAERDTPGHDFRCFFPVGTPDGDAALARNREQGRTAAGTVVRVVGEQIVTEEPETVS
jgi:peptide/nickel transport system ATP-binding protein